MVCWYGWGTPFNRLHSGAVAVHGSRGGGCKVGIFLLGMQEWLGGGGGA